jgi:predicted permease
MSDTSDNDDDEKDGWKDWELIVLTAGICCAVFIAFQVAMHFKNKKPEDPEVHASLTANGADYRLDQK